MMKISAVLCTFNEDTWLEECLQSLQWCDEIIVCDMGSDDSSVQIAEKYASKVISIERAPFIELIREEAVSHTQYEWILFADPDFIFPEDKANTLKETLRKNSQYTAVNILYKNYYCSHEIKHGKWKPTNRYPILFKKDAMKLPKVLHNGFNLIEGEYYEPDSSIALKHMWINSEEQFYAKHKRYIANEGIRRIKKEQKPSSFELFKYIGKTIRRFIFGGISEGSVGWNLTKKAIWYEVESLRRHRLDLLTKREVKTHSAKTSAREIHLYYNYYKDKNPARADEIDYCLERLVNNPYITEVRVITDVTLPFQHNKISLIDTDISRPRFEDIFDIIRKESNDDSVNIYLNSDCFLSEEDTKKLTSMNEKDVYCLGRYEIPHISPYRGWSFHKQLIQSPHRDMQDCWIFVGKPHESMWLDFMPGTPGCDNRLAYEFSNAGYTVTNPISKIHVYHYHTTQLRRYTEKQRVPEPYYFPERV